MQEEKYHNKILCDISAHAGQSYEEEGLEKVPFSLLKIPQASSGMRIGLFGGSFNPPHAGHALVAQTALNHFSLHELWWMVTPWNPMKQKDQYAPLLERLVLPLEIQKESRIKLTAFETSYHTIDTLMSIRAYNPEVFFIWIMGVDNVENFHYWKGWQDICRYFPIAIINRPFLKFSFFDSEMAKIFGCYYVHEDDAHDLAFMRPPVWTYIHGPSSPLSSTAIRNQRNNFLIKKKIISFNQ